MHTLSGWWLHVEADWISVFQKSSITFRAKWLPSAYCHSVDYRSTCWWNCSHWHGKSCPDVRSSTGYTMSHCTVLLHVTSDQDLLLGSSTAEYTCQGSVSTWKERWMSMSGMEGILHGRCKPVTSETDQEGGKNR
jgi:hypothetical protein